MPSRPGDFSPAGLADQGDGALVGAADLFLALVDLDPDDRTARLATIDDEALRRDVAALLAADAEADTVLRRLDRLTPSGESGEFVGETLGPYRVQAEIGRGGMGVVYRAEDSRLGRTVALKVLPPLLGADPEARARLVAEARAAGALDHPNVGTLHDIGETDDGRLYLVLAHYDGETLKARLARGPLPAPEAERVVRDVASGLAAAHTAGIVHRDVKPSNVLLTPSGAKVLDFGIAKGTGDDLTRTGATLGTAAYMSPEQTRGEAVDARADVWALGVLLHEMLAGERPFRGQGEALVHAIRHDDPPPLPAGTPPVLARVVRRALARDPARRYADAAAFLADLDAEAGPPARRWGWAVGAAAVAALVLLAAWALTRREAVPDDAFVIAVAPFSAVGDGAEEEAGVMQALVYRELDAVLSAESGVRVHELRGAAPRAREDAEALGQAAGAHLVVWGDVVRLGDEVEILPSLVQALPYPGAALEASDLAGAATFRADLTESNQLALRRTAAADLGDLALLIAARAQAERGRADQALDLLRRIRRPSAESERVVGLAYTIDRDFAAAERHFRAALALDSTSVTAWEWLTIVLMNTFRPAEAEAEVRKALALLPDAPALYVSLAWTLAWQGRMEESATAAQHAVRLAPESAPAQGQLGWAHFMTGRLEAAAQAFEAATAAGVGAAVVDSYEGLSETRFGQGRFEEAEAAARAALRLRPDHPTEHDLLGRALFAQGRLAEAEQAWDRAAALTTQSYGTSVYYPLLVAYVRTRLGRPDADAQLRALADTLTADRFLAPVLRFAVGQATEAEVLTAAAEARPGLGRDWLREAHWMLGYLYEAGVGAVPADTAKALGHYREAAARDYFPSGVLNLLRFSQARLAELAVPSAQE